VSATAPPTAPPASPVGRALLHVVLAGVLGLLAAVLGAPVLIASLFGGLTAVLIAGTALVCLGGVLAVALDRTAGPGGLGRPGSVVRGLVVGGLGSAVAIGGAFWALRADVGDSLPVPLRFTAAALPFAALAALQWPGMVRIATSVLLVVGAAAVVVPGISEAADEHRTERIVTEVGTTAHPWVSEVEGYRLSAAQATGSPLIWTRLERADGRPDAVLWVFRDQAVEPTASDPCAASSLWTPGGDQPMTSCVRVGDATWLRTSQGWQELARYDAGVRVGVTADPGVDRAVLDDALAAARPMTDGEYDTWLEEGLTPGW
jgi:hypothetical protein